MDSREAGDNQWLYSSPQFLNMVCDVLQNSLQGRPEGQGPPERAGA